MKKFLIIMILLFLLVILSSCQDYLQQEINADRISDLEEEVADIKEQLELSQNIINDMEQNVYTEEEVNKLIHYMLKEMIEIKYDNTVDIEYNEITQTFTITEYNQHGEVFDVDEATIDHIIYTILEELDDLE